MVSNNKYVNNTKLNPLRMTSLSNSNIPSCCLIGLLKRHFMCPCVPMESRILPVNPYLVLNSMGLNHAISLALKNICTIVALFLCTREGYPVNMIRFKITRSGSTPRPFIMSDPLPTNSFVFSSNIKRGEGAYVTGPNAVVPEFECVGKIGVRVRIYQKLLHTTEITLRHESLKLGLFSYRPWLSSHLSWSTRVLSEIDENHTETSRDVST